MPEVAPIWIRLEATTQDRIDLVLEECGLETWCCGGIHEQDGKTCAHVEIDPNDLETVRAAAPDVTVTIEDCEIASLNEVGSGNCFEKLVPGGPGMKSVPSSDRYLNVDEIETALDQLAAAFPNSSERIILPNQTLSGRQSSALRIGAKAAGEAPAIMILGGVHAREWIPPEVCVYLSADLLRAHHDDTGLQYEGRAFSADEVRRIVESLELVVFPCVNPDGRAYSQSADDRKNWRGNRNVLPEPGEERCNGVDLNRNFDFLWKFENKFAAGTDVGTSRTACGSKSQTFRGPSAESEPETRNVVFLMDRYHSDLKSLRWFIDVHTVGPAIIHRWNHAPSQHDDPAKNFENPAFDTVRGDKTRYEEFLPAEDLRQMQALARAMKKGIEAVRGTQPKISSGLEFGRRPVTGLSDDYVYARYLRDRSLNPVLSFTLELSSSEFGHQPRHGSAMEIVREGSAGVLAFCLAAIDQFEGCS